MENPAAAKARRVRRLEVILPVSIGLFLLSTLLYFATFDSLFLNSSAAAFFWVVLAALLLRKWRAPI